MKQKATDLLKKISYIEADIEIQKQILFSIPSNETEEMRKRLEVIAEKKGMIQTLRESIKEVDPEAHERILLFETAVTRFKKLAVGKRFVSVTTLAESNPCSITLSKDRTIDCLVKALDEDGNWTVFSLDGDVHEFKKEDIISD
ncbi:MAG: hypothetical protein V1793_06255 [Pseudomonadota bacterium]